jgi:hypothetical protein
MLAKPYFAFQPMRDFPESIPDGNAGTAENQLPPRPPRSENIGHCFLLKYASGKLDGNKSSWLEPR